MKITKQARRGAKELLRFCQVQGLLDEDRVRQVVQRVIENKPRGYMAILSHFQRLVMLDVGRRTARIESAETLPPAAQTQVQENLTRLYGAGLTFNYTQNTALQGGVRIHIGSDVYDNSIQGRLAALQEKF